jgi:DNA polymerase-3 subunit delta'
MPFSAQHAIDLVRKAHDLGRLGHAYLITGPKAADLEGFAGQMLGIAAHTAAAPLDQWRSQGTWIMRPESKSRRITVDQIRDMEREIHMTSGPSGNKFGVIVDAERLNAQAQNAFLRTLEEPPPGTLFLLLSHQPQQLLTTILSRVIEIALLAPPGVRVFSDAEERLLQVLRQLSSRTSAGISGALSLKADFQEILETLKGDIKKDFEDEFKKEQDHFKQTTDGNWLKQREEQVEALIESSYQQQRDALMDLLLAWMGDIARQQVGAAYLDLPAYRDATALLAERWSPVELNKRITALRKLDQLLHTNVNEGLALEVSFITAFA